jgi:hypothetical protein
MLRLFVLLLLLANGGYFAWSHGLLLPWGWGPVQQSEPQRVAQQIRPEAIRVLAPDEARRLEQAAQTARPPECLQAGPIEEAQAQLLRQTLEGGWPAGVWSLEPTTEPARWIVYMGKYPSAEDVNRKKRELRQLGVSFENLANAALEPGLSLGGHASQAQAEQQLTALAERGVRTARVVQERPEARGQLLKFAAADDTIRPRLDELRGALGGRAFRPCR